ASAAFSNCVDYIYFPEVPFSINKFISDIGSTLAKKKDVLIVVGEGIAYENGEYVGDNKDLQFLKLDASVLSQVGGAANALNQVVRKHFPDRKLYTITLSMLPRAAAHLASKADVKIAQEIGEYALKLALAGTSGVMVAIKVQPDGKIKYCTVPFKDCAMHERKLPPNYICFSQNYVTQDYIDYAQKFILGESFPPYENGVARFAKLKLKLVK
ncbi:MAG: hypothetical protein FWD32_03030, partial [Firmicutes bacterium]|nr:hypothetical protein [Bacillota bacterium]